MMERRKFKRRKPADGEPRNRALDEIEPGVSVPVPDSAKRVFARSRRDHVADLDGPLEPLVPRKRRKPDPSAETPEPMPMSPDDLIERVQDATQSPESAPRRRKPVVVAPKKRAAATPAVEPAANAEAERIRALKKKKARLMAEKKRRVEQLREEEAARQRTAAEDSARQTGLQDALRREANERKESLRADRERLAAAKAARAEAARKKAKAEDAARLQRDRAEAEANLAREEATRRARAEATQRALEKEARLAQAAEDVALQTAQEKAERRRAALALRAAEKAEDVRLQQELSARRKRAEEEARLLAEEEELDDWDDDFEDDDDLEFEETDFEDDDDVEPEPVVAATPAPRRRAAAPVNETPQPRPSRKAIKPASDGGPVWDNLRTFPVDERLLERNHVITAARQDLAHTAFDVLRTRLLQGLRQNGWSRVAITSPSKDCGKTFTAANLALSLSRQENCRTILLDFDMRRPSLDGVFGVENSGTLADMLRGEVAPEDHLRVMGKNTLDIGRNVAFGFNDKVEPYASELLHDSVTAEVLDDMQHRFNADVVLFDMPPALYHDDVMAARNLFDGVLLVVGGGITKASEVKDVERRLGADTPFLGSILNFSEGPGITKYSY